ASCNCTSCAWNNIRTQRRGIATVVGLSVDAGQRILLNQSYATTFLPKIEQYTSAIVRNPPDRDLQLSAAVTPQAHEGIAGQALGMNARQHRPVIIDGAQDESEMLAAARLIAKRMHREIRDARLQRRGFGAQEADVALRSALAGRSAAHAGRACEADASNRISRLGRQ